MATIVPSIPLGIGTNENIIFASKTNIINPRMSSSINHLLSLYVKFISKYKQIM